jgi:hypothetical protein
MCKSATNPSNMASVEAKQEKKSGISRRLLSFGDAVGKTP